MIPSIETIVEDLVAGRIAKIQAVLLLQAHAEGATNELRDHFASQVIAGIMAHSHSAYQDANDLSAGAYIFADAMMEARKVAK